jgi:hypothetical protein
MDRYGSIPVDNEKPADGGHLDQQLPGQHVANPDERLDVLVPLLGDGQDVIAEAEMPAGCEPRPGL